MMTTVHARCVELQFLLKAAAIHIARIEQFNSETHGAFNSLAACAQLHDFLTRATKETDKLSTHFSSQMKRQAKH